MSGAAAAAGMARSAGASPSQMASAARAGHAAEGHARSAGAAAIDGANALAAAARTKSKATKGDLRGDVNFEIHGVKLKKMDLLSQSDGFFEVMLDNDVVYKSKVIKSNANPQWKPATVDVVKLCKGNPDNEIRIVVFDDDDAKKEGTNENKRQLIGEYKSTPAKLAKKAGSEVQLRNPAKPDDKKCGTLLIKSFTLPKPPSSKSRDREPEKRKETPEPTSKAKPTGVTVPREVHGTAEILLSAKDLKKMDKLSNSDGYVEIHQRGKVVHRTEVRQSEKSPKFRKFKVDLDQLCGGDSRAPILFKVWDDDSKKKDGRDEKNRDFIGEVTVTLEEIVATKGLAFELRDGKKDKRGRLVFDGVTLTLADPPRPREYDSKPPKSSSGRKSGFPVPPPAFMDEPHLHIDLDDDAWDTLRASTEYQLQLALRRHQEATKQVEIAVELCDRLDMIREDAEEEIAYREKIRRRDWDRDDKKGGRNNNNNNNDNDNDDYKNNSRDNSRRDRSRRYSSDSSGDPFERRRPVLSEWIVSEDRTAVARAVRDAATVREAIVAGPSRAETGIDTAMSPRSRAGWKRTVSPLRRERRRATAREFDYSDSESDYGYGGGYGRRPRRSRGARMPRGYDDYSDEYGSRRVFRRRPGPPPGW